MSAPGTIAARSAAARAGAKTRKRMAEARPRITARQRELLEFMRDHIVATSRFPSWREMREALGHTSNGHLAPMLADLRTRFGLLMPSGDLTASGQVHDEARSVSRENALPEVSFA